MKKTATTAERLNLIMQKQGLKQAEILEKCKPLCEKYDVKLDKSSLSQYISGRNIPREGKLKVLAQALNVDEAWLLGYDEEEPVFAALDEDEKDLINIFRNFDRKRKHYLMTYLYKLSGDEEGDEE